MAIHSEKEFLETFKEGDIIYYIQSFHSKPHSISWPIKIKSMILNHPEDIREGMVRIIAENPDYNEWHYVSDIINQYHGVCKTEKEATDYLQTRLEEFNNDPKWQEEYYWAKEAMEMMDDFDDYYDDSAY